MDSYFAMNNFILSEHEKLLSTMCANGIPLSLYIGWVLIYKID